MTTLSVGTLAVPAVILAMTGWIAQGCGRTALLAPGVQESPATDAADSKVTPNVGATSQPTTNGACPDGFTVCGRGVGIRCYDLTRSPDHCGECGNACAPGIACQSSQCQRYRCKGALTFKALPEIPTRPADDESGEFRSSYRPVLGDFDRDGILDFAGVPGINAPLGLLLGKGDGTFQGHPIASAFVSAWTAAAADLNGDGWLDLATIASDQAQVTVRLGNGDPATLFETAIAYPTPLAPYDWNAPYNLVLADLDDDGYVDMVASGLDVVAPGKQRLILWRGSASGELAEFGRIPVGSSGGLLVAADWNRDGALDLLFGSSTLRMVLGRGDGTFDNEIACALALGSGLSGNVLADFDRDQKLDLAARVTGIFLGMNGCNFTTLVSITDWGDTPEWGGWPYDSVGVADFNGDGQADLVTTSSGPDAKMAVYLGDGRGGFAAPIALPGVWSQMDGVYLMGDLNNDTRLDLIITRSDGWQVLLNTCP